MTIFGQSENSVIDRVLIGAQFADWEERQRIRQFLGNASLRASALPASAILIVRSLRRALPRLAPLRQKIYLPPEWEQSATEELDRLASQAARPVLGPVPTAAQAVLFLDRAEWLVCLAHDWLQGTLRLHWWWSVLLKHGDLESLLLHEWRDSPRFLPAAFHLMASRSECSEFLKRIPDDQTAILLTLIMRAFAVSAFFEIREPRYPATQESNKSVPVNFSGPEGRTNLAEPQSSCVAQSSPQSVPRAPLVVNLRDDTLIAEPWLPWVHEASADDLPPRKRLLLAQALMLYRAPAKARSVTFQRQIAAWHAGAQNRIALQNQPVQQRVVAKAEAVAKTTPRITDPTDREATYASNPAQVTTKKNSAPVIAVEMPNQDALAADELPNQEGTKDICPTEAPASFESLFAGTCFLLNVALYLRLYADFTAPRAAGLELNIWDFLCLLGSEFTDHDIENDALFGALASLAGRSQFEWPGAHFHPAHEWILPPAWLDAFPETVETREITHGERRQLLHPAGFFLRDTPLEGAKEQENILNRWVNWVSSYVRARLARALGRDDAAHLLCRIPGKLVCTPTRVDVFYSLDSYPIEVRLAGLDRDPGWIPAGGRYVAYQFQ